MTCKMTDDKIVYKSRSYDSVQKDILKESSILIGDVIAITLIALLSMRFLYFNKKRWCSFLYDIFIFCSNNSSYSQAWQHVFQVANAHVEKGQKRLCQIS